MQISIRDVLELAQLIWITLMDIDCGIIPPAYRALMFFKHFGTPSLISLRATCATLASALSLPNLPHPCIDIACLICVSDIDVDVVIFFASFCRLGHQ